MQPGFDDRAWPPAIVKSLDPAPLYSARSIPQMEDVAMPYTLLDAGLLSPGHAVIQIEAGDELRLSSPRDGPVTLEIPVEAATGEPAVARLDGEPITWQDDPSGRPDVVQVELSPGAGIHKVTFDQVLPYGLRVTVFPASALLAPVTLIQRNHAGRRLLLANPITDWNAAKVEQSPNGLGMDIEFAETPAYVVLDLGRVVHGRLVAAASGPEGAIVDIGWDERLFQDTLRPLPHPGTRHPQWDQVDSWIVDGGARRISTIDARAGRYVLIAVWGDSVALRDLQVFEERYPVVERGSFQSSNPRLDEIWQLGVNTAYPSMQDAYADAWRERGQWWGDAYVADHINQAAFGDSLLLRRGLRYMAEEANPDGSLPAFAPNSDNARMLDYGMLWVQSLQDYGERTNDSVFAREMLPALTHFVQYVETFRRTDTGLLDIPLAHWGQSALVDWAGEKSRHGQSTVLNSLYVQTLRDAATVAQNAGDPARARVWQTRSQEIEQSINRWLYLPAEGRYASSILDGQTITPTTHAQVWPLAFGLVPQDRADTVADAALESFHVEIYGMFWALEGLGHAGRIDEAIALIEEHYGMLLDQGATTLWEHWDSNQHYESALSHAWGGGATWFLDVYLLGLRRTGPNSWELRPAFAGVEHAAGTVPLLDGEIDAYWEWITCNKRTVKVNAPETSIGMIILNTEDVAEIDMDGAALWRDGILLEDQATYFGGQILIPILGVRTILTVRLACPD